MPQAIEMRALQKNFGSLAAVKEISFGVEQGEICSLLGPNGAGKSTTISMLAGLLQPSGGEASIMGHSIRSDGLAARAVLGVVPQDIALYLDLSARENLTFWGKMYGLNGKLLAQRVDETLEMIDLVERQRERVGTFSGGMKRRVNIGAALLHHPRVIIMDEPTVGIDPQSRRHILDSVKRFNQMGMTVLYTTHYMEEAEELSQHIAIVDQGRLVAYGTHAELIKLVGEQTRINLEMNHPSDSLLNQWKNSEGVSKIDAENGHVTLLVNDSNRALPRLFESATQCGVRITSLEIREPNLETVFLHLTGKALRD
jgi:ABC-2 type transport system ATP-binding protein